MTSILICWQAFVSFGQLKLKRLIDKRSSAPDSLDRGLELLDGARW
jgi:hypothetical protein